MPKTSNKIVEIGPGLGDLTKKLLEQKDVIAFEIDKDLCEYLRKRFAKELASGKFVLHCGDVLDVWQGNLIEEDYDLVANLPYYVATNIVLKALEDDRCKNILVMLQKEVADKFSAKPKDRNFSALSVIAQSAGEAKRLFVVKPDSFIPPPKVDSAVLWIHKKQSVKDQGFLDFLKVAFSQPRKKLLKNLSTRYDKELLGQIFAQLDLPQTLRPHEATTSIYHQIYAKLKEQIDGKDNSTASIPTAAPAK